MTWFLWYLCAEEVAGLQCVKRILGKVQEMRDQRGSLEKQLRDLIQQDDITSTLVTTERADMKVSMSEDLPIITLVFVLPF